MRGRHRMGGFAACCAAGLFSALGAASAAPFVWSGPSLAFAKPSGADFTLPQNQDFLTPGVVITRADTQGIFNVALETGFARTSPSGTEWATDLNNPGQTIAAANFAALSFTTWALAYANSPTTNAVGRNAVVHLVREDVYLDLRFTGFQGGVSGGAFSYLRSTPVPEPATGGQALAGLCALAGLRRAFGAAERRPSLRAGPRAPACARSAAARAAAAPRRA